MYPKRDCRFLLLGTPGRQQILKKLQEKNILQSYPPGQSRGAQICINPEAAFAIAAEVGFQRFQVALVNAVGEIVDRSSAQPVAGKTPDEILNIIKAETKNLLRIHSEKPVLGIGFSSSGYVADPNDVVSSFPGTEPWNHVPVARKLAEDFQGIVEVCPDSLAGLIAELRFGNALQERNLLYLTMIEGLALGVLSNGKINWGNNRYSGEFGHICINPEGPFCFCGRNGCLETVASSWAIVKQVQALLDEGIQSSLRQETNLDLEIISRAAGQGERLPQNILARAGQAIGNLLAMVSNILDPEAIILAGRLSQEDKHPVLIGEIRDSFKRGILSRPKPIELIHSKFYLDASLIGAAAFVFERIIPGFPANMLPSGSAALSNRPAGEEGSEYWEEEWFQLPQRRRK
jgi:predicted NBD/HSP70 family sugar kinase